MSYSASEGSSARPPWPPSALTSVPHLFRTAAASTAAVYAGNTPHLGSALLHHTDPAVTEKHYNRANTLSAAQAYAALIRAIRNGD